MPEEDRPLHITLSISGHGHHPAAWRVSPLACGPGRLPHYEAVVRRAEEGLLDGVFFLPPPGAPAALVSGGSDAIQIDAMPLIGSLVARTSRIGLGASVTLAHTQPFHTARAFAVLDNLSSGRTAWVLDLAGDDQRDEDFAHVAELGSGDVGAVRAQEYIAVALKLWDSWEDGAVVADKAAGVFADSRKIHPIHHTGPHFSVRGPLTAVRPIQGRPVMVMRDTSPAGLRLAADSADVFLIDGADAAGLADFSTTLRGMVAARGRPAAALRILANVSPIFGGTERTRALDAMADPGATQGLTRRFIGTPEGFAAEMAAWQAGGACDGFNILPAVLPDDAEQLVAEVLPILRRRGLFRAQYAGHTMREHLALPRPDNIFTVQGAA